MNEDSKIKMICSGAGAVMAFAFSIAIAFEEGIIILPLCFSAFGVIFILIAIDSFECWRSSKK